MANSNSLASPILQIQARLTICQLLRKSLLQLPLFGYGTAKCQPSDFLSFSSAQQLQLATCPHDSLQCSHLFTTPPHQSVTRKLCDDFASRLSIQDGQCCTTLGAATHVIIHVNAIHAHATGKGASWSWAYSPKNPSTHFYALCTIFLTSLCSLAFYYTCSSFHN